MRFCFGWASTVGRIVCRRVAAFIAASSGKVAWASHSLLFTTVHTFSRWSLVCPSPRCHVVSSCLSSRYSLLCPPPNCQAGPSCVRLPADKLLLDVVASPSCLTCLCPRWILACPSPHCPAGPLFFDALLVPCVFTSPLPDGSLICTFMFPLFPHVSISPLVSCASASPLSGWYRMWVFLVNPLCVRFPAGPSYEPSRWQ